MLFLLKNEKKHQKAFSQPWQQLSAARITSSSRVLRILKPCSHRRRDQTVDFSRVGRCDTTRYDTRCYFNVRSKAADMSQLNLPHGNDN